MSKSFDLVLNTIPSAHNYHTYTNLVAKGGTLQISATDSEIGLVITVPSVDVKEEGEALIPADKLNQIVRACVAMGGTLSGAHGIGVEKRDYMPLVFDHDDLQAQACVRLAFDPGGRMNPDKVLPTGTLSPTFAVM